jgi:co-chaperonin GroES (HSP10)
MEAQQLDCELNPIRNQIIFEFVNDARKGHFREVTNAGLIIMEDAAKQVEYCRWGRVLGVGEESKDVAVGDIVLIEHLQWTNMFRITRKDYWITEDTEILAKWDDPERLPC